MNAIFDIRRLKNQNFQQIRTSFNEEFGVSWTYMRAEPRPCFTSICLQELLEHHAFIETTQNLRTKISGVPNINYLVLASDIPDVFSLGGDLSVFKSLIEAGNEEKLTHYANLCVENLWLFYNMEAPVTTISLVQGQAMGGGFEAALSAHVLVAEKSSVMGFPEVLFNLFPGMGAISFLSRKVGMRLAEEMVFSGKTYQATELHEMGVVDVLAEDGQGEQALMQWVAKNHRKSNAFQAIQRSKNRINQLTKKELTDITDIWVKAALKLEPRNLKIMERLVNAQNTKVSNTQQVQQEQNNSMNKAA
jgi:DSF synthase